MTLAAYISRLSGTSALAARPVQHVVRAVFDRADGKTWTSIGGGHDLATALADARAGLPRGRWQVAGYEYVYGE